MVKISEAATQKYTTRLAGCRTLREWREATGLTLSQASAKNNGALAACQLSMCERGWRPPPRRLALYVLAYGLTPEQFERLWVAGGVGAARRDAERAKGIGGV